MTFRMRIFIFLIACLCAISLSGYGEDDPSTTFFLMCNDGLQNDRGNVENTIMVFSMRSDTGQVKQMMVSWDTFIQCPGYEAPQLLNFPFRIGGVEKAMEAFNENFDLSIDNYLSISFLNLASLIDAYGGVKVDVSRAEQNAINALVQHKQNAAGRIASAGFDVEKLFADCYLNSYGLQTQLSGIQAVAFGWLQYDSVKDCCFREIKVISSLFGKVCDRVKACTEFYTQAEPVPTDHPDKRLICLDQMTQSDKDFLYDLLSPIFDKSANNFDREKIDSIILSLMRSSHQTSAINEITSEKITYQVFPLEIDAPYVSIGGQTGLEIDTEKNAESIHEFLYEENEPHLR